MGTSQIVPCWTWARRRRRADQTHEQDEETFAKALYKDDKAATLDDLRDAVTTLEEMERTARPV